MAIGVWEFVCGVAAFASIAAWVANAPPTLRKAAVIYAVLAAFFAGTTGYLAFRHHQLTATRDEARRIASAWPAHLEYTNAAGSGEQYRGIILRGMIFLEAHRQEFPEAYTAAITLMTAAGVTKPSTPDDWPERMSQLYQAAGTMLVLVRGIADLPT